MHVDDASSTHIGKVRPVPIPRHQSKRVPKVTEATGACWTTLLVFQADLLTMLCGEALGGLPRRKHRTRSLKMIVDLQVAGRGLLAFVESWLFLTPY